MHYTYTYTFIITYSFISTHTGMHTHIHVHTHTHTLYIYVRFSELIIIECNCELVRERQPSGESVHLNTSGLMQNQNEIHQ